VVPQYKLGRRRLDLVVAGDNGHVAVECDGSYYHHTAAQRDNDARRDRELHRMGWDVLRVRESEFTFDPDRALTHIWAALDEHGIHPQQPSEADTSAFVAGPTTPPPT
jgi:very-short-patch-repair endonuclease